MTHEKQQFLYNSKRNLKIIQRSEIIQRLNLPDVLNLVGYFLARLLLLIVILYKISMVCDCCLLHLSSLWKNSNFQHSGTKGSPLEIIVVRPGPGSDLENDTFQTLSLSIPC